MEAGLAELGVAADVVDRILQVASLNSLDAVAEAIAEDNDGDTVYLTRLQWDIDRIERDFPDLTLSATKEMMV